MSAAPRSREAGAHLTAGEIHSALAGRWPAVLEALGIDAAHLRNRHGPCPVCGGKDRFRFDDRRQRGGWICNQCGAGDGFRLLQLVHGWSFADTRREVMAVAGLRDPGLDEEREQQQSHARAPIPRERPKPEIARPPPRVRELLRTSACPDDVPDAIEYLRSRKLWPLPPGCTLRAHVGVDYYRPLDDKAFENVGRFPTLVAAVRDLDGELVTAHVTYLKDGKKAPVAPPRKTLTPMTGREGCAARLMPLAGEVLGIAEGVETAIAASVLHDNVPTWAALSTALLSRFIPPPEVRRLLVFADRDVAGLKAAWHLRDRLGERCAFELRLPPAQFGDWADALEARAR